MVATLNGLILAGGKSLRMGRNKSLINYHGKPQTDHLYELLTPLCEEVFISCNAAQMNAITLPKIEDAFAGAGPMGAVLSALEAAPGKAWLVVACDLPFLSGATFNYLVAHRNPAKAATVFISPMDGLPEPLITIWEPDVLPVFLQALCDGHLSMRAVLTKVNAEMLHPPVPEELQNVNDPITFAAAVAHLKKQLLRNESKS